MGSGERETIWAFGYWGGLDFSNGDPVPIKTALVADEGCASVCDTNGKLLFYSEGSIIWNRKHEIMKGGTALTPIANTTMTPTSSTSQGVVIVPVIDKPDQYYVFSLIASQWPADFGKLYYSIVDMSLEGGLGAVIEGKKGLFLDDGMLERMTPVPGNNCNVWLVAAAKTGRIRAYEITSSGVNNRPVESTVGIGSAGRPYGCMKVSPDRKKLAIAQMGGNNGAVLYDFDPLTGLASNELILLPSHSAYDICFSPGSTKLYTIGGIGNNQTMQFDLSSANRDSIVPSAVKVAASDFVQIKAGPNGKIYFATSDAAMAEIAFPDLKGDSCGLSPFKIIFQTSPNLTSKVGLPNTVPDIRRKDVYTARRDTVRFASSARIQAKDTTGINYTWNDGFQGPSRAITASGTYWVSYNIPPCSYRADTFYIDFLCRLPRVLVQNSCFGRADGSARIENGDTGYRYTWWSGDSIVGLGEKLTAAYPGTYRLQLRSVLGCDTVLPVYIPDFNNKVRFTADTLVCAGNILRLKNQSDESYSHFTWSFGNGEGSADREPVYLYPASGRYAMTLVGYAAQCTDTAHSVVTVDSFPLGLDITIDHDTICAGAAIGFAPYNDGTVKSIDWALGGDSHFSTGPDVHRFEHSFSEAGTIPVSIKIHFRVCPSIEIKKSINVRALPVVDLGPDLGICPGDFPLMINNKIRHDEGIYEYTWNTGQNTSGLSIDHYGQYTLNLRDSYGCNGSGIINVHKHCAIDIPNAFTPNGDGINDYFFPRSPLNKDIVLFHMNVYNRAGVLLFTTHNTEGQGWDGRGQGKIQPAGVYVYRLHLEWKNGRQETYSGNVTLLP